MRLDRTIPPAIKDLDEIYIQCPVQTNFSNGIPFYQIHSGQQDVVRLDIVFAAGRWYQNHKLQAVFTNRMLREGTATYTSLEISEKLDYYGAWLELSCSMDYTYITLYSLNKYFDETMKVLESVIKEPVFPEDELNTVIDMNIQQYQVNLSKVGFLSHRELLFSLYGNSHPCGQNVDQADYKKVTASLLHSFYKAYYHSGNCAVFLSGKITDSISYTVQRIFGDQSFGYEQPKPLLTPYTIQEDARKRIFVERDDSLQSSVKLGSVTVTHNHPDFLKLRVLITLLGGYFGSRLMSNIREDKGYTYGISAGLLTYPDSSVFMISTETGNEYVEPLIHQVYTEIDKLRQHAVKKDELISVQNYMIGEMSRNYESAFSLSDAWIFIYTSGLDPEYFNCALHAIRSITPDELQDLAIRYLDTGRLKEIVAGKKTLK